MLKKIQLKCTKIKYSGDSVGDDIRIEVESLDKFFGLNMELNPKSERKFDEVIGDFVAEGYSVVLPVNIKIIERDLIFNDVGETKVKLRIDLKKETPQRSVHKIEIHELRNFFSKKKAVFEVTVEALVSGVIMYVSRDEGGWLN